MIKNTHVIVALSGGVDSAVAAARLLASGLRVSGLFMKNWEDDDTATFCASAADYASARAVAEHLEIPLHAANFAAEYRERVFARFLADYAAGLTPNPDVLCNREIKFDVFWRHAQGLGADLMATGHYARIAPGPDGPQLLAGCDAAKDQSYFLHTLDPAILPYVRFPIGALSKDAVRAEARALGLPNFARSSSSGICFIGERRFPPFLKRYLSAQPGPIVTVDGVPMGEHPGLIFYTVGQRSGLGIGGPGAAWYVAEKDLRENTLVIAQGADHPRLFQASCPVAPPHWLGRAPALPWCGSVKIRYRQEAEPARLTHDDRRGYTVHFARPQRAVTPGQSAVFYDGTTCLGGAVIELARPPGSPPPGP